MLSGALRGCDVYNPDSKADTLLFLQPDCTLRTHLVHGSAWLYLAPRLWGEAHLR